MENIKYPFAILLSLIYTISLAQIDSNERAKLYFQEAQSSFKQNNYKQCLEYLDDVEKILNGTNGRVLNLRIKSNYNQGQFIKAEEYLNLFIDEYVNTVTPDLKQETLSYLVRIERSSKGEKLRKLFSELCRILSFENNIIDANGNVLNKQRTFSIHHDMFDLEFKSHYPNDSELNDERGDRLQRINEFWSHENILLNSIDSISWKALELKKARSLDGNNLFSGRIHLTHPNGTADKNELFLADFDDKQIENLLKAQNLIREIKQLQE